MLINIYVHVQVQGWGGEASPPNFSASFKLPPVYSYDCTVVVIVDLWAYTYSFPPPKQKVLNRTLMCVFIRKLFVMYTCRYIYIKIL